MRIWCHGDGVIHKIWLNLIQSQNNYIFKSFLRTTIVSNHRITKKSFYQMPTKFTSRSVSYIISPICVTAMFLYLDCISIKFVQTHKKKRIGKIFVDRKLSLFTSLQSFLYSFLRTPIVLGTAIMSKKRPMKNWLLQVLSH